MSETMKAMVIHAPMQYEITDLPVPEPASGELRLKVEAVGLCGSDLRTIRSGHKHVQFPWTLGHEICGTVEKLGPDFEGPWKVGERLSVGPNTYDPADPYCVEGRHELSEEIREIGQAWKGGFAEKMIIPRESVRLGNLLPAPEQLESIYAAMAEPGSSVIHSHEKAETRMGDTVLVMGAGPIGCLHVAIARASGAEKVFLADLVEERLELAVAFEPDALINMKKKDLAEEVRRLTDGAGADLVITANPAPSSQVTAVELAAKGGRVVLFGGLPHDDSKPGVDMNLVHYKNLTLIGISKFAPRHFRRSLQMLASGRIPGDKLVTHVLPLSEFDKGVKLAMNGEALKVVYEP
ncbi:MAG: zinc-binding dehydrogenase [Spirochaetaceae bacterium]